MFGIKGDFFDSNEQKYKKNREEAKMKELIAQN
jgi:hypothetical protein